MKELHLLLNSRKINQLMIPLVLCIEDDKVTLMLCKIVLKRNLFCSDVITAENGEIALQYFENQLTLPEAERNIPALVLLDLNMPVVDGWGFLDQFAQKYLPVFPNVKVVILSSSINPADTSKAQEYHTVLTFLSKPLEAHNLTSLQENPALSAFF